MVFAAWRWEAVVTWAYVSRVNPAEKCPSIPDTVFTSTPFCRARVANVCLRSWNLILGNPARFSTRFQHPVEHVQHAVRGDRPARGAGNTQGLPPTFSFCSNRMLTVSSASGRVR